MVPLHIFLSSNFTVVNRHLFSCNFTLPRYICCLTSLSSGEPLILLTCKS